jgi:dipeptidyl aminopeptidase/acylaminoacyl peptidase
VRFQFVIAAATLAALASLSNASAEPLAQKTLTPTQTSTPTRTRTVSPRQTSTAASSPALSVTSTQATPTIVVIVNPQEATQTPLPPETTIATVAPTVALEASATAISSPTSTPRVVAATQSQYTLALDQKSLAIDSLRARRYGGGQIKVTRLVSSEDSFRRVIFEYPSDGLRITGMMHIPNGAGPFPVVILDHGYFKPSEYKSGDGTIRAADAFARHGYLTLAPDYRCYAGSQCGSNPMEVGYAIDVLNLIASLSTLQNADSTRVGIWGHSMGGSITIRTLTINDSIKVASLYGAVTGDDEVHYCWLTSCRTPLVPARLAAPLLRETDPDFAQELPPPEVASNDPKVRLHEIFLKSSPIRYLDYWKTPVIIHHGEKDDIVPIQWSIDLADALSKQGKMAVFYSYANDSHVFSTSWQLFMARTIAFFDRYLNPQPTPITATMRVLRHENQIEDTTY